MVAKDDAPFPEALRWMMRQKQGAVVLRWLLSSTGFADEVFNPQNSQMSFNAGRTSVGVELFQAMRSTDKSELTKILGELL